MTLFETIWKSIILGTVQGLTEFLPVSSSGHLTLLQRVLRYELGDAGMMFINVLLHAGTLIAVIAALFRDIALLFKKPWKPLVMLAVATIPAGITGLLFNDKIEALFDPAQNAGWLLLLAVCFAGTALLLLVTQFVADRRKRTLPLGWRHTLPMGLFQAAALFPGISRSGATVAAGVLSGGRKEEVATFSFLMSIPVILGSLAVEVFHLLKPAQGVEITLGASEIAGMCVGVACSAVSGFFAVKLMRRAVEKSSYRWFTVYLVLLSLACFWLNVLGVL